MNFIFRNATTQSILSWMDGLHLLLHPFLESWLFGMRKVLYIVHVTGVDPITIRQSLNTELVTAAL